MSYLRQKMERLAERDKADRAAPYRNTLRDALLRWSRDGGENRPSMQSGDARDILHATPEGRLLAALWLAADEWADAPQGSTAEEEAAGVLLDAVVAIKEAGNVHD